MNISSKIGLIIIMKKFELVHILYIIYILKFKYSNIDIYIENLWNHKQGFHQDIGVFPHILLAFLKSVSTLIRFTTVL